MNGPVNALLVAPDGTLYAGGFFNTAGGVPADFIARWDCDTWGTLGSGMDSVVNALALVFCQGEDESWRS
jgi:hypothetical protein